MHGSGNPRARAAPAPSIRPPDMTKYAVTPTNHELTFGEDEIIVSKTDAKGRLTYANDVFRKVALYGEKELIGQPHSLVRHPDMPRCVFKLLWDTIARVKRSSPM